MNSVFNNPYRCLSPAGVSAVDKIHSAGIKKNVLLFGGDLIRSITQSDHFPSDVFLGGAMDLVIARYAVLPSEINAKPLDDELGSLLRWLLDF